MDEPEPTKPKSLRAWILPAVVGALILYFFLAFLRSNGLSAVLNL
ncbi:MAG: hypothetical protein ABI624_06175 [Casimicrobiaceae bacterium]